MRCAIGGFRSCRVAQIIVPIPDCGFRHEEDDAMTKPDWRDAESYDAALTYDAPALAWEFLRRNPDYRACHDRLVTGEGASDIAALSELRRKWGLCFRC